MFTFESTGINFHLSDELEGEHVALGLQLVEAGLAYQVAGGAFEISWHSVYDLLDEDPEAAVLLGLPRMRPDVVPKLENSGTLSDAFRITVTGWARAGDTKPFAPYRNQPVGPVIDIDEAGPLMVGRNAWDLLDRLRRFGSVPVVDRTPSVSRLHWAHIRRAALAARAPMSSYLSTTIVLIPDHVRLEAKAALSGGVIEIEPTFDDAPDGWIHAFDKSSTVSEVYRLSVDGNEHQIILDGAVRELLTEIKQRIPHRRSAGASAQQVVRNPFAFFGPAAAEVIDVDFAERQLARFEATACRFRFAAAHGDRDDDLDDHACGLVIDAIADQEGPTSIFAMMSSLREAREFVRMYEEAERSERLSVRWRKHELLVDPVGAAQVGAIREYVDAHEVSGVEAPSVTADEPRIAATRVLSLDELSDRVDRIDVETAYSIIRVPSTVSSGRWIPEADDIMLSFEAAPGAVGGGTAPLELTAKDIDAIVRQVDASDGSTAQVSLVSSTQQLSIEQANDILGALPDQAVEAARTAVDPAAQTRSRGERPSERKTVVAKVNIDDVTYAEQRSTTLAAPFDMEPRIAASLRDGIALLPHQRECVAWLQHLWSVGPEHCAGALLADDMGLGKTLEALAFIVEAHEQNPDMPPALVLAPVSLLENWRREIETFFDDDTLACNVLLASEARKWRAREDQLDPSDLERGLRTQLRDGWTQGADVVVTTYDTLLTYEVSFAKQPWSIVVLDEAQAVKNPNALKTRSVLKLKTRFRLACTGTPVENSLTDLWSIFDFIQPSLLGPVNAFGRRYTRAIESGGEERTQRIDELRELIKPQVLRRLKTEVAKDLPPKIFDESCRELTMTERQRQAYLALIEEWHAGEPGERTPMIQLIRQLSRLNSDFSERPDADRAKESAEELSRVNPKFQWLLDTLDDISGRSEKALIFAELKSVQRHLCRHIATRFGIDVPIINGDTTTAQHSDASRQATIDRFTTADGFGVMILSPVAAGVGLNIQAANHVIHYMRHWNPAKEDQATDRAYRIGQTKPVTVYTPVVAIGDGHDFPSFDEKLDALLNGKRELASDMLHGQEKVHESELSDLVSIPSNLHA